MKKLLTFLIMLMVGTALFAIPVADEQGVLSAMNTVEAVPQLADVFAVVTDVSPAIVPAENYKLITADFEVSILNYKTWNPLIFAGLYRQEVNPYFGYSKTVISGQA
jgi:hypothetical protein